MLPLMITSFTNPPGQVHLTICRIERGFRDTQHRGVKASRIEILNPPVFVSVITFQIRMRALYRYCLNFPLPSLVFVFHTLFVFQLYFCTCACSWFYSFFARFLVILLASILRSLSVCFCPFASLLFRNYKASVSLCA